MTLYRIEGWSDRYEWSPSPLMQQGPDVRMVDINGMSVTVPRTKLVAAPPDSRNNDPGTSHAAAAQQQGTKVEGDRRLVLRMFAMHGLLNDFELAHKATEWSRAEARRVGATEYRPYYQTSLGKRRLELVRMGLVEDTGFTSPSDSGSESTVWTITPAGKKEAVT